MRLHPLSPSEVLKGVNNSVGKPWLNRTPHFPLIPSTGSLLHTMPLKALCQQTPASGKYRGKHWEDLSGKALPWPRKCPSSQQADSSAGEKLSLGLYSLFCFPSPFYHQDSGNSLNANSPLSSAWLSKKDHHRLGSWHCLGKAKVSILEVTYLEPSLEFKEKQTLDI